MTPDALERLAAARPEIAGRTVDVLSPRERAELQASILASHSIRPARHRRQLAVLSGSAVAAGIAAIVLVVAPIHSPDASAAILAKATTEIDGHTRGVFAYQEVQYGPGSESLASAGWWDLQNTHYFRMEFLNSLAQPHEFGSYVQNGQVMRISINTIQRTALILPVPASSLGVPHETSVAQLKAQLRSGSLTLLGHQSVDGIDALHLKGRSQGQPLDLWIDPATYNIVRVQLVGKGGYRWVEDLKWLPPTPENLALLKVVIPPGYQRTVFPPLTLPKGRSPSKSSTPPTSRPAQPLHAVFVPTSVSSRAALQQAASMIRTRLQALGDKDTTVSTADSSIKVSGRISPADLRLVGTEGAFFVRPVLCGAPDYLPSPPGGAGPSVPLPQCQSQDALTASNLAVNTNTAQPAATILADPNFAPFPNTPGQDDKPGSTVLLPADPALASQQYSRFVLGPAQLNGSDVDTATIQELDGAGWEVDLRLKPSARPQWDAVAKQGFHQYLAYDLDGKVLSAPLIQPATTDFSSFQGQIQIAQVPATEAKGLAALLGSGPLPVRLDLQSVSRSL